MLSARVVRAAPDDSSANRMRAVVLSGLCGYAWEAGARSAAELNEAAVYFDWAAALCGAPLQGDNLVIGAAWCRNRVATTRFLYTEVPEAASPSKASAAPLLLGTALALAVTVTAAMVLAARAVARK